MRRFSSLVLVGMVSVIGATSCGSDSSQQSSQESVEFLNTTPSPPQKGSLREIENTRWIAETMITDGRERRVPDAGAEFNIDTTGRLSISTGCNTGFTQATEKAAYVFSVGPLAMTKMGCSDEARQQLESQMLQVFTGSIKWTLEDGQLRLDPETSDSLVATFSALSA